MSVVTGIVITCSLAEEDSGYAAIEFINKWLTDENKGILKNIGDHAGGGKVLQCDVFSGAFNHLDLTGFAKALKDAPWEEPESVAILIQGEHDEIMREVFLVDPDRRLNDESEQLKELLKAERGNE